MKRLLVTAALAAGLAATTLPAQAAPWCSGIVGVNCWNGSRICRVWFSPSSACLPFEV